MDVPETVTTALADQPVAGRVCLEAGAGAGNMTKGLVDAGARDVYAVTNDRDHADSVRERLDGSDMACTRLLEADLRAIPLPTDSVELVTAHGLFNVVPPGDLDAIVTELTRVAAPGCRLVVDDYEPLPAEAAIRDLFALENAAMELAENRPALTFYPSGMIERLFAGAGWSMVRRSTLLDPVPWTENHVSAHASVARTTLDERTDLVTESLRAELDRLVAKIGAESAGEMYSLAFRLPSEI